MTLKLWCLDQECHHSQQTVMVMVGKDWAVTRIYICSGWFFRQSMKSSGFNSPRQIRCTAVKSGNLCTQRKISCRFNGRIKSCLLLSINRTNPCLKKQNTSIDQFLVNSIMQSHLTTSRKRIEIAAFYTGNTTHNNTNSNS